MISPSATFVRTVTGLACMGTIIVYTLWSDKIHSKILEKVNSRLPEAERFKSAWWGPSKKERLNREYRRLFPDGNDLKQIAPADGHHVLGISPLIHPVLMTQVL
jgi:hypothetical protein